MTHHRVQFQEQIYFSDMSKLFKYLEGYFNKFPPEIYDTSALIYYNHENYKVLLTRLIDKEEESFY